MKVIILIDRNAKNNWWSWPQLIDQIILQWKEFLSENEILFQQLDISESRKIKFDSYSTVVVPVLSLQIKKELICQRKKGFNGRFLIHDQGNVNFVTNSFSKIRDFLKPQDQLIVMSQAQIAIAKLVFPAGNISVFKPSLTAPAKKTFYRPAKELVYFGRLSPQKNIETLILAMKYLNGFRLTLIGPFDDLGNLQLGIKGSSQKYKTYLKKLVKSNALTSQVHWERKMNRASLLKYLSQKNYIFVCASTHFDESFGASIAEALSMGRLVVTTKWGGLRDWVKQYPNQIAGIDVPSGLKINEKDFAEAVKLHYKIGRNQKIHYNKDYLKTLWLKNPERKTNWEFSNFACQQQAWMRSPLKKHRSQVFLSMEDPLCQTYLRAMGMNSI